MGRILYEAFIALMAAFGFCCALRTVLDWILPLRHLSLAVEIRTREDADMLDMLLHEARSASFCPAGGRITVLFDLSLMDGTVGFGDVLLEDYREQIECFGARWYAVDLQEGEPPEPF